MSSGTSITVTLGDPSTNPATFQDVTAWYVMGGKLYLSQATGYGSEDFRPISGRGEEPVDMYWSSRSPNTCQIIMRSQVENGWKPPLERSPVIPTAPSELRKRKMGIFTPLSKTLGLLLLSSLTALSTLYLLGFLLSPSVSQRFLDYLGNLGI